MKGGLVALPSFVIALGKRIRERWHDMRKRNRVAQPEVGPDGYANWRCAKRGMPLVETLEVALYTDAQLVGHGSFGPYMVINTIPTDRQEQLQMAAVLRLSWHIPACDLPPDMTRSNQETFHGGGLPEEVAALISLALGIRMQPGGVIREFLDPDDPRGTPVQHGHRRPYLPTARKTCIPSLQGGDLGVLEEKLAFYPNVRPEKVIEVVRAARSYQLGAWMADVDPEFAWLKFVSALETAANCWWRGDNDPAAALEFAKPELAETLRINGSEALVAKVGHLLKDQLRATRKFYDFTARYKPEPPIERPPIVDQTNWNELDRAIRRIYGYRSMSLHAGQPFPPAMLEEPWRFGRREPSIEKPLGLAAGFEDSVWQADELPMLLHVFEYITRESLLHWMRDPESGPTT